MLVANFVGVEGNGRLHGGHRQQLKEMIRHHVAERAGGFVESAAMLDADRFRRGDLHVVHVVAVPKRLDDVVGKAENHDVLHGLFTEIVIDAINLLFCQDLPQILVELLRGSQVVAKRLFDDDARPVAVFFLRQTTQSQHLGDRREKPRGHGEIKKAIPCRVVLPVGFGDLLFETLVSVRVLKIAFDVVGALTHPIQQLRGDRRDSKLGNLLHEVFSKAFCGEIVGGKSDDRELLRKKFFLSKVAQSGYQFPLGEVTGGAANGHHARRGR